MLLAEDAGSGSNSLLTILPILLLGVLMYFLLIRPQSKRRREALSMQGQLGPGDEVQTVGGLYGTVTDIDDESVTLEAAPGVNLRFARGAIAKVSRSLAAEAAAAAKADAEAAEADSVEDSTDAAKSIDSKAID